MAVFTISKKRSLSRRESQQQPHPLKTIPNKAANQSNRKALLFSPAIVVVKSETSDASFFESSSPSSSCSSSSFDIGSAERDEDHALFSSADERSSNSVMGLSDYLEDIDFLLSDESDCIASCVPDPSPTPVEYAHPSQYSHKLDMSALRKKLAFLDGPH